MIDTVLSDACDWAPLLIRVGRSIIKNGGTPYEVSERHGGCEV